MQADQVHVSTRRDRYCVDLFPTNRCLALLTSDASNFMDGLSWSQFPQKTVSEFTRLVSANLCNWPLGSKLTWPKATAMARVRGNKSPVPDGVIVSELILYQIVYSCLIYSKIKYQGGITNKGCVGRPKLRFTLTIVLKFPSCVITFKCLIVQVF